MVARFTAVTRQSSDKGGQRRALSYIPPGAYGAEESPAVERSTRFWIKALGGNAIVTLLLAGGMAFTIRSLATDAGEQVEFLRAKEAEITRVEQLRWIGELIISTGRGYLISGEPNLLTRLRAASADFDKGVASLRTETLTWRGESLVGEVERTAKEFRRVQRALILESQVTDNREELVKRFDDRLVPLREELGRSLGRLVDHKEMTIDGLYEQAERARNRLVFRMYGVLIVLVVMGFAITWYFARQLSRAYRKEQEALDAARAALATRDDLMGVLAHDLRNPLNAITMKAALLRAKATSAETQGQAESIEKIGVRMAHLIKNMLEMVTLDAGRFSVSTAPCAVEDLIHESSEIFETLTSSKQMRLEQKVKEAGLSVCADRERILEVLSNLLGNALKFSAPGGVVTITVERQRDVARFAVSDTGPGIEPEHVPHLFERFWTSEKSGKKGTGLGMFIAKGIVEAHGGRIWVESAPGHGATFYFTLPIVEPEDSSGRSILRAPKSQSAASHR